MKKILTIIGLAAALAGANAADEYWRTDGTSGGTWTSTFWNIGSATTTGGTGWTTGNNAVFTAISTLTFASTGVGNVTVSDGVTVSVTQAGTLATGTHDITVGSGATLTWTGQAVSSNSASSFTKDGTGTWNIGSQANSYTGGFTLNLGTVIVTGAKSFGTAAMTINGGTIQSSGGSTYGITSLAVGGDFTFAGTGIDIWGVATGIGSTTRTITNSTTSTATRTFSGVIFGSGGITLAGTGGSGGIVFSNANTYTGDTKVSGGLLVLSHALALQNSALDTSGAGTVTLSSVTAPTFGGLKGSTNLASVITGGYSGVTGITLNPGTGVTDSYSGIIANGSGATTLTKTGAGTQIFSGTNSFTGATTVTAGTLLIEGSQSGTGTVTVQSGGTLGGDGSIAGSLSLASGAKFAFSLTKTFTVNGTSVSFGGFAISDLVGLDSSVASGTYALINGSAAFDFTNVSNIGSGSAFDLGSGKSAYFQTGGLNVVVVPEPKTWVMIGIGSAFMLWNVRRRRNLVG